MTSLPHHDPTRILDDFRASALSQLLVAGTTKFDVGRHLSKGPLDYESLCARLELAPRPATVLLTGLRSMGLVEISGDNLVQLTETGREKLDPNSKFNLRGYIGLGAFGADAQNMMSCLESDAPTGNVSFVYHEDGGPSALDDQETSDALTRAMAARARNVAPYVAEQLDLSECTHLLDIGGGHGIYSLELLGRYPNLAGTIVDRAPPLEVAREYAAEAGLSDRVQFEFADIHSYKGSSAADAILLANILHDYSEKHARDLVTHYSQQLHSGGVLVVLDAFLESISPGQPPISSGPREVAAYSAMLFSICEGRCYRRDEYESMLTHAGLELCEPVRSVPAHGSILVGRKP